MKEEEAVEKFAFKMLVITIITVALSFVIGFNAMYLFFGGAGTSFYRLYKDVKNPGGIV